MMEEERNLKNVKRHEMMLMDMDDIEAVLFGSKSVLMLQSLARRMPILITIAVHSALSQGLLGTR